MAERQMAKMMVVMIEKLVELPVAIISGRVTAKQSEAAVMRGS